MYAFPLVAVVGHKTRVAAESADQAGAEVDRGIAKLGEVDVLGTQRERKEEKSRDKVEGQTRCIVLHKR